MIKNVFKVLWRIFIHPATFVVLSLLWCLDLGLGSIVAYYIDPQFSAKMDAYPFNLWMKKVAPAIFPYSLWVYILVTLTYCMVISLLLCSVNWFLKRRKRLLALGEVLVHLGFLLIFAGFVIGSVWGARSQGIMLPVGSNAMVPGMGVSLRLDDIQIVRGTDGKVLDTVSSMALMQDSHVVTTGKVRLNHPLMSKSLVVYPRGFQPSIIAAVLQTPSMGTISLRKGDVIQLENRGALVFQETLVAGQQYGRFQGPGIFLAHLAQKSKKQNVSYAFLSPGSAHTRHALLGGEEVTLKRLITVVQGNYDVHYDPGVWFVLVGTLFLACGTVWALIRYLGSKSVQTHQNKERDAQTSRGEN